MSPESSQNRVQVHRLQPDRPQIDPPFPHRRAPQVDARHRARKRKQRVGGAVLGADHALQLRLEGVERLAEGDEHEPGARRIRPGHRAAQHEGFRRESLLRGALHVRRRRRVAELLVVALAPADAVVLVLARHRRELVQVVHPLLHGGEARAIESRPLVAHDRGLGGFLSLRVLGAVLVPGQVEPAAVLECVDDAGRLEGGSENLLGLARAEDDVTALFPAQPAPQGGRSRGHFDAWTLVMRKRAKALDSLLQREEEHRAEPYDAALAVQRCGESPQRGLRAHALLEAEREIARVARDRGEDSGLGVFQRVSFSGCEFYRRKRAIASATRSTATISSPSILCFGWFALGMIACVKPSFAASFNRSCPRGAGRTSPARPISPNTASFSGSGLSSCEETIASSTARSAAGSLMRTPPTAFTNTSWS